MHDIDRVLEETGEDRHAVRFALDDDDDDDDDRDDEKGLLDPRDVEPAFRRTDLDPVHDELSAAAGADTVAVGYCTGGTVLADHQRLAHRDPDIDGFAAAVVLDAPSGIETEHQTVTVSDYPHDDLAAFYDADIPAADGVPVPRADVYGTDHLWRDVPDDIGRAVYTTLREMADGRDPASALAAATARYEDVAVAAEQGYDAGGQVAGRP